MCAHIRKMFRRHDVVHSVGGLAAVVLAMHLLVLLSPAEGQKRGQPLTKLRYAVPSPSMSFTSVFLAAEKKLFEAEGLDRLAVTGGVACNRSLRDAFRSACERAGFAPYAAAPRYTTDNAAMIAAAGFLHYEKGEFASLDIDARSNFPL